MNPSETSAAAKAQQMLRSVRLTVVAKGAREVIITGDFTAWAREGIPLLKTGEGVWEAVLQLAPGAYQYRFLVDGKWRDHADAKKRVPNLYGGQNCVLEVS